MNKRVTVTITGRVQGVNFRHYTLVQAQELGVSGWVRNLPDGSVEGCFEGEEAAVDALVSWCRKGPAWSRVDNVATSEEQFRGEFDRFSILR